MKRFLKIVVVLILAGLVGVVLLRIRHERLIRFYSRSTPGSLSHGGKTRTFHTFAPTSLVPGKPAPLLLCLHGGGGTGQGMELLTLGGFNTLAERSGFLVVYPDGLEKNWNDGRLVEGSRAHRENLDDLGFLDKLIDTLSASHTVDPKRIFFCGISNGAFMSARVACELADRVAAVGLVTGTIPENRVASFAPSQPVSVAILNGREDPLVPWEGGNVGFSRTPRGRAVSTREAVEFWIAADGCATEPVVTDEPDRDPADGTRVRKHLYSGGRSGSAVALYEIVGGGHTWPGGHQYLFERWVGRTSRDIDACQVLWEFFQAHPKP